MRTRKKYPIALLLLFVVCFLMTTPFVSISAAGEPITDVRIRRAIAACIDREEITEIAYGGLNEPLFTMVPELFAASHIETFVDGSPDHPWVAGNMTAAGYSTTNPYEMDLWYSPSHYGSMEADVAQIIESQLEDTGYFDVNLEAAEWSTYLDQLGEMPFFLLGWWYDYPDPSNYIDPFVGAGAIDMGTNYESTEMNGYLDTMLTDLDLADRTKAHKDAQTLMAEDVPCIPLCYMLSQFLGFETDVTGAVLEPSENVHYDTMAKAGETQVTVGTSDKVTKLDPSDTYDYFSSNTLVQITHGPMEFPRDSADVIVGPIIDWYNVTTDGKVYHFNLKSGVKFSDGTDCNATAMKWNWDRAIALGGDPGFLLEDVVTSVDVVNNTLFKVTLNSADVIFLQRLTYTVAWPVSMSGDIAADAISGDPDHIPHGVGPYMITSWTKDTEIVLEKNPYYDATLLETTDPVTDKIIIKFYASASALLLALESGDVNVAHRVFGPDEMESVMDDATLDYDIMPTAGIRYLLFKVEELPEETTATSATEATESETEATKTKTKTKTEAASGFGLIVAVFTVGTVFVTIKRKRSI